MLVHCIYFYEKNFLLHKFSTLWNEIYQKMSHFKHWSDFLYWKWICPFVIADILLAYNNPRHALLDQNYAVLKKNWWALLYRSSLFLDLLQFFAHLGQELKTLKFASRETQATTYLKSFMMKSDLISFLPKLRVTRFLAFEKFSDSFICSAFVRYFT